MEKIPSFKAPWKHLPEDRPPFGSRLGSAGDLDHATREPLGEHRTMIILRGRRLQPSAVVVRKYRRLRRRRCLRQEYHRLRSLLPRRRVTHRLRHKVGVVDAAYRYICDLQTALVRKFAARGVPSEFRALLGHPVRTAEDVQTLALHLIRARPATQTSQGQGPTTAVL